MRQAVALPPVLDGLHATLTLQKQEHSMQTERPVAQADNQSPW